MTVSALPQSSSFYTLYNKEEIELKIAE